MKQLAIFLLILIVCTITLSPQQKTIKTNENDGLQKGDRVVDFGMRSLDVSSGKLKKFVWITDYVGKKKPKTPKKILIVNFFANWCKPCLEEMPFLQKLHEKYAQKGVQVLSINFRGNEETFSDTFKKSKKIVKEKGITYPVLFDRFTNRNQLIYLGAKVKLPSLFVIDKNGIIVERISGEDSKRLTEIEKKIENMLR